MTGVGEARQNELDVVLDEQHHDSALADELFAIVDLLDRQPALRRALTNPSTSDEARDQLVGALFGDRVSPAAQHVLNEAARRRWGSVSALAAAVERQGVRALLSAAQEQKQLDTVEEELFRFGRAVDGDNALRAALSNRTAPLDVRERLVDDLLRDRANPVTVRLAQRAVSARGRTFDLTLEGYLHLAAALRRRAVAEVVVARPLSDEQLERLRNALMRQLGRELSLRVTVDPGVLGGVRVSVGDEVIEGTVAGKLTDAERQIR